MSTADLDVVLRDYYEQEAALGARPGLRSGRVALRTDYLDLVRGEGRRSIIDFGAGPGRDLAAFSEAGLHAVGIDLAVGNARLAAARTPNAATVIPGSILAPPIRPRSFQAAWSISTLMHLDTERATAALDAMAACLEPGAPLLVGVWGGNDRGRDRLEVDDSSIEGRSRPFHLRSPEANRALFLRFGPVEQERVADTAIEGMWYQTFVVRRRR